MVLKGPKSEQTIILKKPTYQNNQYKRNHMIYKNIVHITSQK